MIHSITNIIKLSDFKILLSHLEIQWPQIARNLVKKSMVGENFEIWWSQMARNALKLSTMVGEKFEKSWSQMARNVEFKLRQKKDYGKI